MQTTTQQAASPRYTAFITYDEEGFIIDPNQWTETLATILAESAGIKKLTKPHLDIIHFIRERYLSYGSIPPMRIICRKLGTERDAVKGLFGGCLKLWRIAGLPNPGEEAKAYMD